MLNNVKHTFEFYFPKQETLGCVYTWQLAEAVRIHLVSAIALLPSPVRSTLWNHFSWVNPLKQCHPAAGTELVFSQTRSWGQHWSV